MEVAIVHDYLTQRGGAERVVLSMLKAFPDAPLHTSLYDPEGTFPEFRQADVRPMGLNRMRPLQRDHRLALPVLARAFSRLHVEAEIVLCSSSGWAHGVRAGGRKLVYCYSPARWLYQSDRYLGSGRPHARAALRLLRGRLLLWDHEAAATADHYLTSSTAVRERIRAIYRIDAEILPPPHTIDPKAPRRAIEGLEPGFFLCVSRLLPYKNVDAVVHAFADLPAERLVIVGTGPEMGRLMAAAGQNVRLVGSVADEELRWLYASCEAVVAASYEDYGLTPLEGAAFGKPAAALRFGGFLDTLDEARSGVFFDEPDPDRIRRSVVELRNREWDRTAIEVHADRYSEAQFIERLRRLVRENANERSEQPDGLAV